MYYLILVGVVVCVAWLVMSMSLWVYRTFHPEFLTDHQTLMYWVFIGALGGFWVVGGGGVHALLFFLPDSWGTTSDGEFQSYRSTISAILGLAIAWLLIAGLNHIEQAGTENRRLRQELEERERAGRT